MLAPWMLVACGALLPHERVLGREVPASIIDGEGGGFGAALALEVHGDGLRLHVESPLAERVDVFDRDGRWLSSRAGPLLDPVQPPACRGAGSAVAACGPQGQTLALRCEADCAVLLQGVELDRVGPGGDVAFVGALPCWSDVQAGRDEAPGVVRCLAGSEGEGGVLRDIAEGIAGEHLGQQLAAADDVLWASGRFTRWDGTPRGRVVPVVGAAPDGSDAWIVEQAGDASPLAVAAAPGWLAVGVPGHADGTPDQGRVFLVELGAL